MRCLITGGHGYLGSALHQAILNRGFTSLAPRRDVMNVLHPEEVAYVMNSFKPDVIFHFAGSAVVKTDKSDQALCTNIVGTHNICEAAPPNCRVVLASSVVVYGRQMDREVCTERHSSCPNSLYGASKAGAESVLQAFTNLGKIRGVALRMCAVVGPNPTHGVLKDFVRKLREDSSELEAFGNPPGSCKPYITTEDMASAAIHFGTESNLVGAVNICNSEPITIKQVAQAAMRGLKINKSIKWLGEKSVWAGDNPQISCSNMMARLCGWKPQRSSEEAVEWAAKQI